MFQIRKPRFREVKYLAKGHTVSAWGNPGLQAFSKTLQNTVKFLYLKDVCKMPPGM